MLKCTDPDFERFGEIYFSKIYPGAIKGWHVHAEMALNYACVVGMIKLALYDSRKDSPTHGVIQEIFIGDDHYALVHIPPGVVNGFKCVGSSPALVANCTSVPHDPSEITRIDPFTKDILYDWDIKHG